MKQYIKEKHKLKNLKQRLIGQNIQNFIKKFTLSNRLLYKIFYVYVIYSINLIDNKYKSE